MKRIALALAIIAAVAPGAEAQDRQQRTCESLPSGPLSGEGYAVDGDTIVLIANGVRTPNIRIFAIDAPELRDKGTLKENPDGMRSRHALDMILAAANHRVVVTPARWDVYCRIVADVTVDGVDVALTMLRQGMAYAFTTYLFEAGRDPAQARAYIAAERLAREKREGLWQFWLD